MAAGTGRTARCLKRAASYEVHQDAEVGEAAKRSRSAVGSLSAETDAMAEQVKALISVLSNSECATIEKGMRGFGFEGKPLRMGSLCTGSGMGEVALQRLAERLGPFVSGTPVEVEVVFSCEYDEAKAQFLMSCEHGHSAPCFKDITDMGAEYAAVWPRVAGDATQHHAIQDVDLLVSGWSCKDLSTMSTNAGQEMTEYIMNMLQKFMDDPAQLEGVELEGSTLPTLIGCLKYIDVHRPRGVLMENVQGCEQLMPLLRQWLMARKYEVFSTTQLTPDRFALPNTRPRVYIAAQHSLPMTEEKVVECCEGFITSALQGFAGMITAPISNYMYQRDHPHLKNLHGKVPDSCAHETRSDGDLWQDKHVEQGLYVSTATLDDFWATLPSEYAKWYFSRRPLREQHLAFAASKAAMRLGMEVCIDITQSSDRFNFSSPRCDVVPCFTGGSEMWCGLSRNPLCGAEALGIMGLSMPSVGRSLASVSEREDSLFKSVAGNAFSGPCVLCAFAMMMFASGSVPANAA